MLRYLLHRPIGVSMALIAVVIMGVVAVLRMPTGLMPEAEVPELQVEVTVPSGSPAFIDQAVMQPLSVAFQGLYGLSSMESISGLSVGQLKLTFDYNTDMQLAYLQTQEKIDQQLNYLPEINRPVVRRVMQTDIPIARLQVTSDKLSWLQLTSVTKNIVKRRIEQLDGVGLVAVNGAAEPIVRLAMKQEPMANLGVKAEDVIRVVKSANFQLTQLKISEGNYEYDLTFDPLLSSVEDIANLSMRLSSGNVIRLGALVTVESTYEEPQGIHLSEGQVGLVLAIHKQQGADQQALNEQVLKVVSQLNQELPLVRLEVSQNQTYLLQESLKQLLITLLLGCMLAAVILGMFSSHWKGPLMMFLLIPIAMIMTVGALHIIGLTLNIISMSGMILGVGILIDNGIIMIDNIQSRNKALPLLDACVAGANEIMPALISSTLTTLAVFLPLLLMEGISGTLFQEQVITLAVVLVSSLLAAFFVLPLLYRLLQPRIKQENSGMRRLIRGYQWSQRQIPVAFWWVTFGALLIGGWMSYQYIPSDELPEIVTADVAMDVKWSRPIPIDIQRASLTQLLSSQETLVFWEADIGNNAIYEPGINDQSHALLYVQFATERDKEDGIKQLSQGIATLDSAVTITVTRAKNPFDQLFSEDETALRAKLRNQGRDVPPEALEEPMTRFGWEKEEGFLTSEGIRLAFREERLQRLGIDRQTVLQEVRRALADQHVTSVNEVSQSTPIFIRTTGINTKAALQGLKITTTDSSQYPLEALVTLTPTLTIRYITSDAAGRFQSLKLKEVSRNAKDQISYIGQLAKDHGWVIQWEGSYFDKQQSIVEMSLAFSLAILLLYVILAAQFESVALPLIILAEIPISLSGALLVLQLTGYSLNLSSMMGMVIMLGIIINDSILKVDTIKRYYAGGMTKDQAIHQAGQDRLKPILMTSLTTILALVPVLLGTGMGADLQAPLAVSVIGGLLIGTICSVYLIPILFRLLKS